MRKATVQDAAALGRVHVECWRQAYGHFLSAAFLASRSFDEAAANWTRTLERADPNHEIVVLEVDAALRGFAMSGPTHDADPVRDRTLYSLYQLDSEHGSGSGKALLEAVLHDEPASLWVAELNPRARAFYTRNGFIADGAQKNEPRWENLSEIRMVR